MAVFFPEGRYACQVIKQGFLKSRSGSLVFVLHVEVQDRYKEDGQLQPLEPKQRLRRNSQDYITPKTAHNFKEALAAIGYKGKDLRNLDPNSEHFTFDLRNEVIALECRHEEYRGKTEEKWKLPLDQFQQVSVSEVEAMNHLFAGEEEATGDTSGDFTF